MDEEFNEKFDNYREALDYIAELHTKAESTRKLEIITFNQTNDNISRMQKQTQYHLDQIMKNEKIRLYIENLEKCEKDE